MKVLHAYSASDLRLPKLHSWVHHICLAVQQYGSIDGFTTETYETLHKCAVKNPYRCSNRKQASDQMLRTVGFEKTTVVIF